MKVGLSINPETDVKEVVPYLEEVDMILGMCVHPGFGGQKFIPESLDKIRAIRAMLNEKNLETDIQVECKRSTGCRSECDCFRLRCIQRGCRRKYCKIYGDTKEL